MRISLHADFDKKKRGYSVQIRLHMSDDEVRDRDALAALDLGVMAYGNASAKLQARINAQDASGAKPAKHIAVQSSTDDLPDGIQEAIADLLKQLPTVKPTPEFETVRTMIRAALINRYRQYGMPDETLAAKQRRLHEVAP